jgi:hypothetical protein
MVINADKVENARRASAEKKGREYQRDMFRLGENLPGLKGQGEILNKIVTASLEAYPRKYLLIGVKNKEEMSAISYTTHLHKMFQPKNLTQTLIRKSFVNHFYRKGLSYADLSRLAQRMRHSINVAQQSYMKQNAPCDSTFSTEDMEPIREPIEWTTHKKEPKDPRVAAKNYRSTPEAKEKMKEYRLAHRHQINRSKYLWMLNHDFVNTPQKRTLSKYGIVYDKLNKRYIYDTGAGDVPDVPETKKRPKPEVESCSVSFCEV